MGFPDDDICPLFSLNETPQCRPSPEPKQSDDYRIREIDPHYLAQYRDRSPQEWSTGEKQTILNFRDGHCRHRELLVAVSLPSFLTGE